MVCVLIEGANDFRIKAGHDKSVHTCQLLLLGIGWLTSAKVLPLSVIAVQHAARESDDPAADTYVPGMPLPYLDYMNTGLHLMKIEYSVVVVSGAPG